MRKPRLGRHSSLEYAREWLQRPGNTQRMKILGKRWREANRDKIRGYHAQKILRRRSAVRAAKDGPCSDCGVAYPHYVMDFDHPPGETKHVKLRHKNVNGIRQKGMSVGTLGIKYPKAFEEEVLKC